MSAYSTPPSVAAVDTSLNRFWQPPPASVQRLPGIRRELARFPSPALSVSRVAQLDASLLDNELESILGGPVWKALDGLRSPGKTSWEPEMMALLRIAVLKMSLYDRGATYGSNLQNLKYRNEWNHQAGARQSTAVDSSLLPLQKAAYMTLQVLPAYLHARARDQMLSSYWSDEPLPRSWFSLIDPRRLAKRRRVEEDGLLAAEWKRVAWEVLNVGEKLGAIAGLVNFLVFLYDGRYRTLIDRVLGMRLIYAQRSITPNVSFEFLNRQLVWEAFTEFLLFLMPLINIRRIRTRLIRFVSNRANKHKSLALLFSALPAPVAKALGVTPRQRLISSSASSSAKKAASNDGSNGKRPEGPLHFLPDSTCPVCYAASNAPPTSIPTDPTSGDLDRRDAALGATASSSDQDTSVKIPYTTDCGWHCRYCYYCVVGKLASCEEEGEECWSCLRCGGQVRGVVREVQAVVALDVAAAVGSADDVSGSGDANGERRGEGNEKQGEEEEMQEVTPDDDVESVGSEHDRWRQ